MKENPLPPYLKALSKEAPAVQSGWFQSMHHTSMFRRSEFFSSLPLPKTGEWNTWLPKLGGKESAFFQSLVEQVELHSWQFGMEEWTSELLIVWKQLSPQARGRAMAGLSERLHRPPLNKRSQAVAAWLSDRWNDSLEISLDPDSTTQIICNLIQSWQDPLLRLALKGSEKWAVVAVSRELDERLLNDFSEEFAGLSPRALDRCLEAAVRSNHSEAARLCLEVGADPDINVWKLGSCYNERHCALSFVLDSYSLRAKPILDPKCTQAPLWQVLLDAGANAAGTKFSGLNKPLFHALRTNNQLATERLLDSGASFQGGELLEHFAQGHSDHLVTANCSASMKGSKIGLNAIKERFKGLMPFTEINQAPYFYIGDGQGGNYTSFLMVTTSLKQIKLLEARGLPLKPTIVELLAESYPFERMKYIAKKTCGTPEHIMMHHFRKLHPDCGTHGMQFLCRPEPNGSNVIENFNPHGQPSLKMPDGTKFYVDLDSIAAAGHKMGSIPEKHIFVRKIMAKYRRRKNHLITRGLQAIWEPVPVPGTTDKRLAISAQISRLLPVVKEQDGKFFWTGINFDNFERLKWPSEKKQLCEQWMQNNNKSILLLARERIINQHKSNQHAPVNVLANHQLEGYPHEFWPYLRQLQNGTIGVTRESCMSNPPIQSNYELWALENKPDLNTFIPDPRLMKLPWWDSAPWEMQPFFHIDSLLGLATTISSQNRNDYEKAMIAKAINWKNDKVREDIATLLKQCSD